MVNLIKNYIQCDDCGSHLSYNKEDIYIDYNWRHTHRIEYIDCPNCGNSVAIKRIDENNK